MTIEQIIQLTQAGFNADQITALAPLISGEAKPEPKPEPEPKPNPEPAPATLEGVMRQIAALTQAITANAIINTNQPGSNTDSAEDALASIVIPGK